MQDLVILAGPSLTRIYPHFPFVVARLWHEICDVCLIQSLP
jgi:hypothetical protein